MGGGRLGDRVFAFSRLFALPLASPGEPSRTRTGTGAPAAETLAVEAKSALAAFQRWCHDFRELEELLGRARTPVLPGWPRR